MAVILSKKRTMLWNSASSRGCCDCARVLCGYGVFQKAPINDAPPPHINGDATSEGLVIERRQHTARSLSINLPCRSSIGFRHVIGLCASPQSLASGSVLRQGWGKRNRQS